MEEDERSAAIGEAVTPTEGDDAMSAATEEGQEETGTAGRSRQEGQSHEENRRYQAARIGGERTGYDRAMREINERIARAGMRDPQDGTDIRTIEELEALGSTLRTAAETNDANREASRQEFIARDAEAFAREYPQVSLHELDGDPIFRRFCGSRYGKEPLAELYGDYLAVAGRAQEAALARAESKGRRATGSGGSDGGDTLTAQQQKDLDAWNRAFPQMRMSAKEFLARE